jgi:ferredoxin
MQRRLVLPLAAQGQIARRFFMVTPALRNVIPGKVKVTFVMPKGDRKEFSVPSGTTLMEAARSNGIDMEAACDGTCACSTCHVYLDKESYGKLAKPSEDELDMLDLAPDVKQTSRLACQVPLTEDLDGLVAHLPENIESQF